jgi:putative Holliday junction resolvase
MTASATRILGLDLGSKRVGLAVSDADARIAFPAGVLERRGRKADLAALRELCTEREVGEIVVGLPIHLSGRKGPAAVAAADFARALAEATGLPVALQDERWTTREAERALGDMGQRREHQRRHVDEVAATLILRTYLALRTRSAPAAEREDEPTAR